MRSRYSASFALAALGTFLLVAASLANAAPSAARKKGGTMRINMSATDVDFSDPSLAYGVISWQIEYATALKLVNYPDKPAPAGSRLQPEAAVGMPIVSKNGKQYTFKIKSGLKLSNGETVTAKNFQKAIFRALTKSMQSPAVPFIGDIVGADKMIAGQANSAAGVIARGNTLILKLNQPDGGMLSKLAMPFFQALSLRMANDPKGVDAYPSGGPYYISSRIPNRRIVLKTNPFYKGPRPHNISSFDITVNTNLDQSLLQVKANQVDYDMGGLPPTAHADLAKTYGVNKGQYQVHQLVETDYVALNSSRPAFGTATMRKAANFAIDRPAMLRVRGAFAGKRTDQVLPPGMGGFQDVKAYPLKGADFDAALVGWNQDYPDPYDFLDVLLNGNNIHDNNNNNLAYFNNASVNAQLAQANKKIGAARYKAYGSLDLQITKQYAPRASYDNRNLREFISAKIGGYLFQPANASADLNTLFLK